MSALHCPARVHLAPADGSEDEARELGRRLRGERVVRVWTGPLPAPVRTAEAAAAALGVAVVVRDGLRDPGDALLEVLDEVADEHRGEAVLVVLDAEAVRAAAEALLGLTGPAAARIATQPAGVLRLEADDEGWRRVSG